MILKIPFAYRFFGSMGGWYPKYLEEHYTVNILNRPKCVGKPHFNLTEDIETRETAKALGYCTVWIASETCTDCAAIVDYLLGYADVGKVV